MARTAGSPSEQVRGDRVGTGSQEEEEHHLGKMKEGERQMKVNGPKELKSRQDLKGYVKNVVLYPRNSGKALKNKKGRADVLKKKRHLKRSF